jgi:hypothetical protein
MVKVYNIVGVTSKKELFSFTYKDINSDVKKILDKSVINNILGSRKSELLNRSYNFKNIVTNNEKNNIIYINYTKKRKPRIQHGGDGEDTLNLIINVLNNNVEINDEYINDNLIFYDYKYGNKQKNISFAYDLYSLVLDNTIDKDEFKKVYNIQSSPVVEPVLQNIIKFSHKIINKYDKNPTLITKILIIKYLIENNQLLTGDNICNKALALSGVFKEHDLLRYIDYKFLLMDYDDNNDNNEYIEFLEKIIGIYSDHICKDHK